MFKIYTDASYKDGVSSHHYYIMKGNRRIKRRTFIGIDETSMKAEATSIIKALQWVDKKGWYNVTVFTDCLPLVNGIRNKAFNNEDYRYIDFLLMKTRSKLKKRSREDLEIVKADTECRKMMATKMRRVV